jgi:hypothetical protein
MRIRVTMASTLRDTLVVAVLFSTVVSPSARAQLFTPPASSPPANEAPANEAPLAAPTARRGSSLVRPKSSSRPVPPTPSPSPSPKKGPPVPLTDRAPLLSDLEAILSASDKPLAVHLWFSDSAQLGEIQIAQGAAVTQALALRSGYRPLLSSYGSALAPDQFNVIIGTLDQVGGFISPDEAKKVTKGYVAIGRLPNAVRKDLFVLLITGRTPEDVDRAILSLGFVRVRFPDAPSASIREVILPLTPMFIRQSPLEANKALAFSELQERGAPVKSLPTGGVSLDLFFPGYFRNDSDLPVTINLHYLLQVRTFRASSSIVVRINNREIAVNQSAPSPSAAGGTECSLSFPVRLLEYGRNLMEITMSGSSPGTGGSDDLHIFSDSELVTPKLETGPKLPDLRLESRTFFPFIGQPDGSDLAVLLTDRDEETINASWTLLARLAQSANTLFYAAQLTVDKYDLRRNVLVVGTYDHLPNAFRGIVAMSAFDQAHVNVPLAELDSLSSGTNLKQLIERALNQRKEREEALNLKVKLAKEAQATVSDRDFGVLATAPPRSTGQGWSMVVTAFLSGNLLERLQSLVTEPFWKQIRGDIVRWKVSDYSFQARVPGEAQENGPATLVELPLGERLDFRVWVGAVAGTLILFVLISSRVMKKFDQAFVLRQRRKQ